jgi:hypothetical protein
MPSVKVRHTDATWRQLTDGKLRVKWGAGWVSPSLMYIQSGGAWRDTGYRGYPAVPINVGVYAWDYGQVRIQWAAGAGGAPVAAWHIVQTNSAGGWLREYEVGGSPSPSGYFPVSTSTNYRFYVRAKGTTGLYSDWGASVGTSIGKPASTYYTTEQGTRPWSLAASTNGYKDQIVGVAVATNRVVESVTYNVSANGGFTSILSPYNNREIYRIANSGQGERFSWQAGSVNYNLNVGDYWGNGGITGYICRGTGWSIYTTGTQRAVGTVTAYGYETYSYQQAHTIPAVANSYW